MSSAADLTKIVETDRLLDTNSSEPPEYKVAPYPRSASNDNITKPKIITNPTPSDDDDVKEENGSTLMIAFCLMLFFQLGNRIFGRLETFPMHNYPLFMNILSTLIYVPICFAYILPVVWSKSKAITQLELDIPKYKFGVMVSLILNY